MPLNVANWNDKQLDELADLLRASDYSAVASFIANNFLATGSRVMTDPTQTTLRVTVNSIDGKAIDLSPGIFVHNSLCSDIPSAQTVNILNTATGLWGTGQDADNTQPRWSIIEVRNNEQIHTPLLRWFVDDSVDPNTYSQQLANTLIDKAYYDIVVKHGTPGAIPVVPGPDTGYFTIAEIYVPADPTHANPILPANIYDTAGVSNKIPTPSWTTSTRVLRIEFWSTLFGVDHSLVDGHHREGVWHIGTDVVTSTAAELNKLHLSGGTVTPASLKKLTDGSALAIGELHQHTVAEVLVLWDSGWFYVSIGNGYNFSHTLGTLPRLASVWFSANANGSNARLLGFGAHSTSTGVGGLYLTSLTTTTLRIVAGTSWIFSGGSSEIGSATSGYARVVLLK